MTITPEMMIIIRRAALLYITLYLVGVAYRAMKVMFITEKKDFEKMSRQEIKEYSAIIIKYALLSWFYQLYYSKEKRKAIEEKLNKHIIN
ncbi:MAG: hypothetical protein ACOCV1_08710 [Bacillota bacterium]